ncbi:MAG: hypothetical protein Q7R79_01490 [bacterium]|nr:hypothetical protein [bacterium]
MGSGEHGPMMGPGKMGQGDESGFGEEQEARVNEQRFKGMKQGTGQAKRMINGMKKMVTQQEKKLGECGVSLPVELKEAVSSSNLVIAKLEAAKTADELEEIFTDLQEVVSPMQEWGPKLGDLHRLCEMVKRAGSETKDSSKTGKEVKRLQKLINTPRYKTQISLGGRIDITDLVSEYKEKFGKLQESLAKVKDEAKTDPEAALETLEDSFYGTAMSDLQSIKMAIDMVENMTRGLQSAKRDISGFEKALKGLKRQNVIAERKKMDTKDTSELESLVSLLKANVAEITAFVKVKGFDPDELVDKVQAASEVREDIQEKLAELRGVSEFVPQIKGGQNFNFQLPDAFNFSPQGTPGMSGAPETGSAPGAGFGPGPGDQSGFGPQGFGGPGSGAGPGFGGPSGPPSGGFGF